MAYTIPAPPDMLAEPDPDPFARAYLRLGLLPPWRANWRNGRPAPLGAGGIADRYPPLERPAPPHTS